MLTIWGRLTSVNVQKVVLAADELGLPYQRREAGGAHGIVGTPAYRAMNPNGQVPVIEEDGFVLWESNAIVRYLAASHGEGSLWPREPRARADADRWMDWQTTEWTPGMRDAFWNLVRTPPERRDAAALKASFEASEARAAILDAHLAGRRFVAGDALTMGDIALLCAAHRWLNLPAERVDRPHLRRWYEALMARPSARATLLLPIA